MSSFARHFQGGGSYAAACLAEIVLNRKYVYNKALPVRRADGLETHRTVKLCTPHNETHCMYAALPHCRSPL